MCGHVDHPLDFGGLPLEQLLSYDELDLGHAAPLHDLLHDAVHDVVVEGLQDVQLLCLHGGKEFALKIATLVSMKIQIMKLSTLPYQELHLVSRGLEVISCHLQDGLLFLAPLLLLYVGVAQQATVIWNHLLDGVVLNLDEIL